MVYNKEVTTLKGASAFMKQSLSTQEKRRAWLWASGIVVLLVVLCVLGAWLALRPQTEEVFLPQESAALLAQSSAMDDITVTAVLDVQKQQLSFTQTLSLRNRTGEAQSQLLLRSWSGAYWSQSTSPAASDELFAACYGTAFDAGGLTMVSAEVDGQSVPWSYWEDDLTVLSLPVTWLADSICQVTLECLVEIPTCASRFGVWEDVYMLGNVFPLPAVWQAGEWRTDAYCAVGDPFVSECANWDVALRVPHGWQVGASAVSSTVLSNGEEDVHHFVAHGVRDFALVVRKQAATAQVMAGDVLITAYAATAKDARQMAQTARRAVLCFSARYGNYPYPTLTLCQVNFPYGGMEYPCMVMISADAICTGGDTLETTIVHETAHQWWAMTVGSDSFFAPWQDESLCEYAVLDYLGDVYGEERRQSAIFERVETALRITLRSDLTPGSPIDYFADLTDYSIIVYQRGAGLWTALESYLGRDTLQACLQAYYTQYTLKNATRADLERVLEVTSGKPVSALFLDYLDTQMP